MLSQIKKILYATDLSKNSAYAFYCAVDMAKKYESTIVILHIIEPMSAKTFGTLTERVQHDQQVTSVQVIQNRLQSFCEKVDEKDDLTCVALVTKILVRSGYPAEEILKAADEEECDLIVLGSHGKGFIQKTFLGSVSRSVLDRTRKPVFIIPLPSENKSFWDEI
jgi:nucleotide-binding universal stress UspA family protein